MKKGLIPFYRDLSEGNKGYTLFLDRRSNQVYKSYHKGRNNFIYWILFALVLILFRGMKNVYLPWNNIVIILIVLLLTVVGIGIYLYYYKDLREEYFTDTMIEEYIEKGDKTFIKELITVIVVFLFVVLFAV